MKASILIIHKTIFENQPKSIADFFTFWINKNDTICSIRKPILFNIPKSNSMNETVFVNSLYLYNELPYDLKRTNPKTLSKYLNKYISNIFPSDKIVRIDPGSIFSN